MACLDDQWHRLLRVAVSLALKAAISRARAEAAMTKGAGRALRVSMLLFGATCASAGQNSGRVLVSSDVVAIRIVDHPELDTTTRVEPDGTINFPYVGRIQAAGRSEDDLGRAVGRRLVELKIIAAQ